MSPHCSHKSTVVFVSLMSSHWSPLVSSILSESHKSPFISLSLMSPHWSPWVYSSVSDSHEYPLVSISLWVSWVPIGLINLQKALWVSRVPIGLHVSLIIPHRISWFSSSVSLSLMSLYWSHESPVVSLSLMSPQLSPLFSLSLMRLQ